MLNVEDLCIGDFFSTSLLSHLYERLLSFFVSIYAKIYEYIILLSDLLQGRYIEANRYSISDNYGYTY